MYCNYGLREIRTEKYFLKYVTKWKWQITVKKVQKYGIETCTMHYSLKHKVDVAWNNRHRKLFLCLLVRKCQTTAFLLQHHACLSLTVYRPEKNDILYNKLLRTKMFYCTVCKLAANELQKLSSLYCVNLCAGRHNCNDIK